MEKEFDKKWLQGLKYRFSKPKEVERDGRTVTTYVAKERPMRVDDVLSWKDQGDTVIMVTADGRKLTVYKDPKKAPKEPAEAKKPDKK